MGDYEDKAQSYDEAMKQQESAGLQQPRAHVTFGGEPMSPKAAEQPAKPWPETPKPAEPWGQGQATTQQGPGASMLGVGRPMTAHRPSLGRIVLVRTHGELINGQEEHAAMITQVWSDTCINLTMFPGAGNPQCWTSIQHVSTMPPEPYRGSKSWRWPDRV